MQELTFNMKKRITKSQFGKLVNAQVRKLLGEDKNSEIEQSWNEYDKLNNKNINKAAKFSPLLAKDYNHNVEDGCEGAEDYCRYGLEEKINRIVSKYINEAYAEYGCGKLDNSDNEYDNVYEAVVMIKSEYNMLKFTALAQDEESAINAIMKQAVRYSPLQKESDVEILDLVMVKEGTPSPEVDGDFEGFGDDWDEERAYGMERSLDESISRAIKNVFH